MFSDTLPGTLPFTYTWILPPTGSIMAMRPSLSNLTPRGKEQLFLPPKLMEKAGSSCCSTLGSKYSLSVSRPENFASPERCLMNRPLESKTCTRLFIQPETYMSPSVSTATPLGRLNSPMPSPLDPIELSPFTVTTKDLDSVITPVCYVNVVLLVEADAPRGVKLARTTAHRTEASNVLAI